MPANHPYTGYIQIMQQCWQADEKQRPSFKEALVALFQLKRTASDAPPSAATAAPVSGSSASVASTTSSAPAAVAANHQHQHASTSLNHSSHNNLPHTNNHSQVNNSVQPLARTTSGHKPSSTDPRDYDWYYGQLSKDDAINLLMGKPIGHFLVRASSREGCYAASVVVSSVAAAVSSRASVAVCRRHSAHFDSTGQRREVFGGRVGQQKLQL